MEVVIGGEGWWGETTLDYVLDGRCWGCCCSVGVGVGCCGREFGEGGVAGACGEGGG